MESVRQQPCMTDARNKNKIKNQMTLVLKYRNVERMESAVTDEMKSGGKCNLLKTPCRSQAPRERLFGAPHLRLTRGPEVAGATDYPFFSLSPLVQTLWKHFSGREAKKCTAIESNTELKTEIKKDRKEGRVKDLARMLVEH